MGKNIQTLGFNVIYLSVFGSLPPHSPFYSVISFSCLHAASCPHGYPVPHLLISLQKYIPSFLVHVDRVVIDMFEPAGLLAHCEWELIFHKHLWLEARSIHPI
jgi:hypothetical protein